MEGLSRAKENNDLAPESIVNPSGSEDYSVNDNNDQEWFDVRPHVFQLVEIKIFHSFLTWNTKVKVS